MTMPPLEPIDPEAECDDEVRGTHGVVCSLRALPDGRVRVMFDGVSNLGVPGQGPWKHDFFFTWKDFDAGALDNPGRLSEAELAQVGFALLVRAAHAARS